MSLPFVVVIVCCFRQAKEALGMAVHRDTQFLSHDCEKPVMDYSILVAIDQVGWLVGWLACRCWSATDAPQRGWFRFSVRQLADSFPLLHFVVVLCLWLPLFVVCCCFLLFSVAVFFRWLLPSLRCLCLAVFWLLPSTCRPGQARDQRRDHRLHASLRPAEILRVTWKANAARQCDSAAPGKVQGTLPAPPRELLHELT